jgi:hypothetical protein
LIKWKENSSKHFQVASVTFYVDKFDDEPRMNELPTTWLSHCEPFRRFSYDKNQELRFVCFVKDKNFDHEQAKAFCETKHMELYDANASQTIYDRLVNAAGYLFNSSDDQAFVRGRYQDECNVINGNGALVQVSCDERLDFFCEYFLSG